MRPAQIAVALLALIPTTGPAAAQPDNIGHDRHLHRHGEPHARVLPDGTRFITNRQSPVVLPLPTEQDAFTFAIFGDRTGGPVRGVGVLADAVRDTNLFEPDFVITVGDLVEGYNTQGPWLGQMREFKGIMDQLLCPWFPVAGNHDIYWRGEGRPPGEHEHDYEMNFGPLWYAFEHKNSWFIALFSDEGNPQTGEKAIDKPASQVMSDAQLSWLRDTLSRTKDAEHVFVFLHHPRWLKGNYGDDWEKVHRVLVEAGNVTAVFAGHIHRMRYDGPFDGIEYVTLATVGGAQSQVVPDAGWLHQYHLVTVRKDQISIASVPVGEVQDVREMTGQLGDECARLSRQEPAFSAPIQLATDGSGSGVLRATMTNTATRPIDVTATIESGDSRWMFIPDHQHDTIEPGQSHEFLFHVERLPAPLDGTFRVGEVAFDMEYLAPGHRYEIPSIVREVPIAVRLSAPPRPSREMVLDVDGRSGHLRVPSEAIPLSDGPMTLECWFSARAFGDRVGLLAKTESSDYGFFVSKGVPEFDIFLGDRYAEAKAPERTLSTGEWHHLAGVYDGSQVRLYVDGRLGAKVDRAGTRRQNGFPLIVGADVNGAGDPTSFFDGLIDGVRLSSVARYTTESFEPQRRFAPDRDTLLLLNMDAPVAAWIFDESPGEAHPRLRGAARVVPAPEGSP
ncbi:MAG: metallophosphoesterase [Phycisphaeraceae bacterium]|nr:metallophosphoesterase [Phycisphaeraceae bacterium]